MSMALTKRVKNLLIRSIIMGLAVLLLAHGSADGQTLQLCLAGAADYSPVYPTTSFPVGSTEEVTAVVRLAKGESYRNLGATWTAVDVGKAGPPNQVIKKANIPLARLDRASIYMRSKAGPLPPGKYRLPLHPHRKPRGSAPRPPAPGPG